MKQILVETSARHVHVTQETLEKLFGPGAKLEVRKMLSQPGQFASDKKIDIIGPINPKTGQRTMMKGLSILGPCRNFNQVELSATDARSLKLPVCIKESGCLAGSAGITLVGPAGTVEIKEGCIVAKRHIHMTPADAAEFGVQNGDIVNVKVCTQDRCTTFGDVVCRVNNNYALAMHIDTDESNAANCSGQVYGILIK